MIKLILSFSLFFFAPTLFATPESSDVSRKVECLAKNMYFEARGEGQRGLLAVAHVTINRVQAEGYPSRVCDVVYQKNQFSWTSMKLKIKDYTRYEEIKQLAYAVLNGETEDPTKGATHFHSKHIRTNWKLKPKARIGNHIFY